MKREIGNNNATKQNGGRKDESFNELKFGIILYYMKL